MKEKYTVEVAGISLSLMSEESEEYIKKLAEVLNTRVNEMILSSKRISKTDAAMFCALDYLDMKLKTDLKLRETSEQFKAYEKMIEDLKRENDELRKLLGK